MPAASLGQDASLSLGFLGQWFKLTIDMEDWSQEEKCELKYVMHTPDGQYVRVEKKPHRPVQ